MHPTSVSLGNDGISSTGAWKTQYLFVIVFLVLFSVNRLPCMSMLKWEIPWIREPKSVLLFCACWFKKSRWGLQNCKIAEWLLPACLFSRQDDLWDHSWPFRKAKTVLQSLSCLAQRSEQGSESWESCNSFKASQLSTLQSLLKPEMQPKIFLSVHKVCGSWMQMPQ